MLLSPQAERPSTSLGRTHVSNEKEPTRYDIDLQRRVSVFLASQHRDSLRKLKVEARDGIVKLQGNVPSFYEREISVRSARCVAGVMRVVDEIIVGRLHIDPRCAAGW